MKQIAFLFEYFKLAFAINKENKGLYKPQIILILLKACLVIVTGVVVYNYVTLLKIIDTITKEMIFAKIFSTVGLFFVIFIVSIFIKIAFEAGLYNMYKDCIKNKGLKSDSFSSGVKAYFGKFILADILMLVTWVLMLFPYVIIGFVTMFAGFIFIPIIVSIFTAMWKVSIVMDDSSVVDGLKKSFRFAKINFWPLSFLIIIKNSFTNIASSGGSGSSSGSNISNFNSNTSQMSGEGFDTAGFSNEVFTDMINSFNDKFNQSMDVVFGYIKLGFFILIPVISIAVVISSLIKMIFDVFFSLSIFVMYSENEESDKIDLVKEVL
ncbi:MAG: hypothetical protein WBA54_03850 [Acidaminobacteraceae bacterium]